MPYPVDATANSRLNPFLGTSLAERVKATGNLIGASTSLADRIKSPEPIKPFSNDPVMAAAATLTGEKTISKPNYTGYDPVSALFDPA